MAARAEAGRVVRRHRIARGTLRDARRVILVVVAMVGLYMFGAALAISLFHLSGAQMAAVPIGLLITILSVIGFINLPGRLLIGAEGMLIDWRGERRYVGFAELAELAVYTERSGGKTFIGVGLTLVAGETVKLPLGEDQFGADARAAAICADATQALHRYRKGGLRENASELERGDRTVEAWLTRLRSIAAGANAGPRAAVVTDERLWRIVEDPAAGAGVRAGAAAALASNSDPRAKERLRVAAADTAEPRLRVALESAAAGDDDALLAALAEVDAQPTPKRRQA